MNIYVKAYDIARSADLAALKDFSFGKVINQDPLIFQAARNQYLVIFDYGVVVFFNYSKEEIAQVIAALKDSVIGYKKIFAKDDFLLTIKGKKVLPSTEGASVSDLTLDYIKLISTVLSRSVALEYYEKLVDQTLGQMTMIVQKMAKRGWAGMSARKLNRQVGLALAIQNELAYNLEILDEPELLWSGSSQAMVLYRELVKNFDLNQRIQILDKKIKIIAESNQFVIDQLQTRQSHWLEWIVIILIALEIVYFVGESWFK